MEYAIAIAGGFIAGIINTLAGNGSVITLSILTEVIGLPGNIANATNRVGVLAQTALGSATFYRHGKLDIKKGMAYFIPLFAGALIGIYLATIVSPVRFMVVFKLLTVLMFFVILVNPKRWLHRQPEVQKPVNLRMVPLFFLLGIYSGFIQMGMGVFFLALMVLGARFDLMSANAMKVFVVAMLTIIALAIFSYKGLVDWRTGGVIALGQGLGGWAGAQFGSRYPQANVWAYRLLVVMMLVVLIRFFVWR